MKLAEILRGAELVTTPPQRAERQEVTGLAYDSRRVKAGNLFFAFPGARTDGRKFAAMAIEAGACAVASEAPAPADFAGTWLQVIHGRRALAVCAKNFYRAADERLHLTGITGTNGKTTTSFLSDAIDRAAGRITGLIGTIEYRVGSRVWNAVNTTPESLDVFELLGELEGLGGTHLTMEVSSHALDLGRVHGIHFETAVVTNFTRDHLDYHGTMEAYFEAKRKLFLPPAGRPPRIAVANADDPQARAMADGVAGERVLYGIAQPADARAERVSSTIEGLRFDLNFRGRTTAIESKLTGTINVYNILAAAAGKLAAGLDPAVVAEGVRNLASVPGRFERVDGGQPFLVAVDYAHTDDALRNVIRVARGLTASRVITLFGCGGDRDRSKRPLMGAAAAEASDFVVLTSDNPRGEDPLAIINDATVGLRRFDTPHVIEPDRAKAIRAALRQAAPGDVVILAGKGHERSQVLRDRTIHFDDREAAREALRELGYPA